MCLFSEVTTGKIFDKCKTFSLLGNIKIINYKSFSIFRVINWEKFNSYQKKSIKILPVIIPQFSSISCDFAASADQS